eukprot:gnl/TRDRNA2_/TRDRNA2_172711_c0_seq1.p1 gnl/TRDRNA2_/TRDRNA2_172711_c0~~gnl/TRDRNA2_/TRDRNA2_172711_c0_seq1.p1  ORF type:complete len:456 (+),score=48.47 gnl/TRDRNA2_/TRDRNA2_172711_c0_seq1:9-1376(+)
MVSSCFLGCCRLCCREDPPQHASQPRPAVRHAACCSATPLQGAHDLDSRSREVLQRCVDLERDDKLMLARETLRELGPGPWSSDTHGLVSPRSQRSELLSDKSLNSSIVNWIMGILKRVTAVELIRKSLSTDEEWELQSDSDGIRTFQKPCEDPNLVHFRVEGFVDAPIFNLIALLYEIDLWDRWCPSFGGVGLSSARLVTSASPTRFVFHIVISLPWPFDNREALIAIEGVDCMNQTDPIRQVVVLVDSAVTEQFAIDPEVQLPALQPGCERIELYDTAAVFTPAEVLDVRTKERCDKLAAGCSVNKDAYCLAELVVCADLKTAFPQWMINSLTRNFSWLIISRMRWAVLLTNDEEYQCRMRDPNNAFYSFLRRRIREELPAQYEKLPPLRLEADKAGRPSEAAASALPVSPAAAETSHNITSALSNDGALPGTLANADRALDAVNGAGRGTEG